MHVICKCTAYIHESNKRFSCTSVPYDTISYFNFVHELSILVHLRNLFEHIGKCAAFRNDWYVLYQSNQSQNQRNGLIN